MKGQTCASCGYKLSAAEAIVLNIGKVAGDVADVALTRRAMGTNTISNATRLKCPKCGQVGRWI
ncbi:hypothetical protein [Clostridium butyricum]